MTSRTRPQEIVERVLAASKADGCVVIVEESTTANVRWATNTLTTNGVMQSRQVVVVSLVEGASGTSAGVIARSVVDANDIDDLVRRSEAAARDNSPAEDAQPLITSQPASADWEQPPHETGIDVFATFTPSLGDALAAARGDDRIMAGFAEHELSTSYLGTSSGLRLRHDQPTGKVEMTARSTEGSRSAWTGVSTRDFTDVDVAALDGDLRQRLGWAKRRVDLEPGRYETVLPPTAVSDLLIYMYWTATGRDAHDGRTVFTSPGGGTRVGERLTDVPLTLRSNPNEPGLECAPFVLTAASSSDASVFDNGLPINAVDWIRDGALTSLVTTRHSAALTGLPLRPAVDNLILDGTPDGGDVASMVAATEQGLLLTCLWYIREVDPRSLLLTGLTRDGVYRVENGEVTGAVNNFRFNESPVDLLTRVSEVGRTSKTLPREWSDYFTRTAMPPVRVPDFHMSSVSQAS